MSFRFVHAADLHLDSPLRSLALRAPQVADLIGTATRQALVAIVDLCLAERVDALLIAGDLYDGDQTSMKTARFLADQLGRLHAAGIVVHIIRGNHDALSRITRELVLPPGVHVYGERAQAVALARPDGHVPVVVHGISFARPQAPDSLLPQYPAPTAGAINIGLMHSSLGGAPGHDVYAPVSAAELGGSGHDYWALGHIHKPARHVAGRTHVVMPGNPQGRDVGESGVRGVVLATVGADGRIALQDRRTSLAEFARVTVDATGADDWAALVARLRAALERARAAAPSPHLVARVRIAGATPLAWQIRRDHDLLTAEAEQAAADTGQVWVEKLEIACTLPGASDAAAGAGPLADLRALIASEVLASPGYAADLGAAADELLRALPPVLRPRFGDDAAALAALLADLAREGSDDVLARLDDAQDSQ